jgi:hypothetical protein
MWYYSMNNIQEGPVDEETIRLLLDTKSISLKTFVWQPGMSDWKRLEETFLATLSPEYVRSGSKPGLNTSLPRVELRPMIPLFFIWLALQLISLATFIVPDLITDVDLQDTLVCAAVAVKCLALVFMFILMYKLWQVVQDGQANTSAGKAVGLMFIPVFNFFWVYRLYFGLSLELNRYIERTFAMSIQADQVRRSKVGFSLLYCILDMLNLILLWASIVAALPEILSETTTVEPISTSATIFTDSWFAVIALLKIVIMTDYLLTTRSISKAQQT